VRRCHTAGMPNSPPGSPRVNDVWIKDDGELRCWDGEKWQRRDPRENDVWIKDDGELRYWDGDKNDWALYEDPPEWPGDDQEPRWLYRGAG
jgi:hypothetical protein